MSVGLRTQRSSELALLTSQATRSAAVLLRQYQFSFSRTSPSDVQSALPQT